MSIIIFLISLAILVLVHEFGHFIVAKKSGIRVDEFGLGFPPKIWGKKWNGTLYTINSIPFGGFVKIFGEDAHTSDIKEEERGTSFYYKPKWIQSLVLVAGVAMNLIFAWFLISLGFMIGLPTPTNYKGLGEVKNAHVTVVDVLDKSPAYEAGLRTGDQIISASSGKTNLAEPNITPEYISSLIDNSSGKISFTYKRGKSSQKTIDILPDSKIVPGKQAIGISMEEIGILKLPIHLALIEGAKTTWQLTLGTAIGLGTFFWHIISFHADFSQVSGPIGIASTVSQATSLGFVYLITLVALISINLAIINLVPFPALDGGRLFFVLIEAITRRKISTKVVQYANMIGFTVLIILMLFVTGHDILKLL